MIRLFVGRQCGCRAELPSKAVGILGNCSSSSPTRAKVLSGVEVAPAWRLICQLSRILSMFHPANLPWGVSVDLSTHCQSRPVHHRLASPTLRAHCYSIVLREPDTGPVIGNTDVLDQITGQGNHSNSLLLILSESEVGACFWRAVDKICPTLWLSQYKHIYINNDGALMCANCNQCGRNCYGFRAHMKSWSRLLGQTVNVSCWSS